MAAIETRPNGHQSPDVRPDFERARDILNHWLARDGLIHPDDISAALESLNRVTFRLQTDFEAISDDGHRARLATHEAGLKRTTGGHNATGEGGRREW